MIVHSNVCQYDGCSYSFKKKYDLINHTRTHNGCKPFQCDQCNFKTSRKCSLVVHRRYHSGIRPFKCDVDGCGYSSPESGNLLIHKRTHSGIKPFKCSFPGCGFKSVSSSSLISHKEIHTIRGQIRRKKQENRLHKILTDWGFVVDCEVTINAKRGNCVSDSGNRYFSRLDFVLVNCITHHLIVECDENQHFWYVPDCEMSRMVDVKAAMVLAGYTLPIHWVRYSPCGKYMVNGERDRKYIKRVNREIELKKYLNSVCSGEIVPTGQMSIHYMFYNRNSENGPPEITNYESFPEYIKPFTTWKN